MSKQQLMDELYSEIRVCRKCRLWINANKAVLGEGNLNASIMFIGEAPGYTEDLKGRPFVGRAGKVLDELLTGINIKREDVYLGNLIKHRPKKNRDPRADEINACAPYLNRQIQIIKPKIVITLGRHSTKYLLSKVNVRFSRITDIRGNIYKKRYLGIPMTIMPTLHPAATLNNNKYMPFLKKDFQKLKRFFKESD